MNDKLRIIDIDGQEYEVGEFRGPRIGEFYLGPDGVVRKAGDRPYVARHVLTPIRKRHVFGNVIFEETGEEPRLLNGEFGFYRSYRPATSGFEGTLVFFQGASDSHYTPLKLVGLVEEQDNNETNETNQN